MAVKILTDILILEREGLVGFTKEGEQVPLNTKPKIGKVNSEELEKGVLIFQEGSYMLIEDDDGKGVCAYALYTRRS